MTITETSTLVFKDQAGGYYLLPRETLEQGRVPAAHTAEVERLIAEQADTQGHMVGYVVYYGALLIGFAAHLIIGYSGPLENGGGYQSRPIVHPERAGRPFE